MSAAAVRPGERVGITIAWQAWTTVCPGLVACRTPQPDESYGAWQLTHAPTGFVVAWFDGPEQAQAAAGHMTGVDWLALDPALAPEIEAVIASAVVAVGGTRAGGPKNPQMWSAA